MLLEGASSKHILLEIRDRPILANLIDIFTFLNYWSISCLDSLSNLYQVQMSQS